MAGKLCNTDMPPFPQNDPFLPEGPAFLCFLPCSFPVHLDTLVVFPVFSSPPLAPFSLPFLEDRRPVVSLLVALLSSPPLPLW